MTLQSFIDALMLIVQFISNAVILAVAVSAYQEIRRRSLLLIANADADSFFQRSSKRPLVSRMCDVVDQYERLALRLQNADSGLLQTGKAYRPTRRCTRTAARRCGSRVTRNHEPET